MTKTNDYDRFAAMRQDKLKKGESLPHKYIEKPAMQKLLPDLTNKTILMLGCGTGEESELLEKFGATDMQGIDLSEISVKLANESYPTHQFEVGDMHSLNFADNSFDFVYSSLTVHYSDNPQKVYEQVMRVLKPGGSFLFSIGHPMRWASERVELNGLTTKILGYSEGNDEFRSYGNYSEFCKYDETFESGETLSFWVGPPSMHFKLLREAGFKVNDFVETKAIEEVKVVNENYYKRFSKFPQFMLFNAGKSTE